MGKHQLTRENWREIHSELQILRLLSARSSIVEFVLFFNCQVERESIMSDAELSDVNDDDDIVRRYENNDDNADNDVRQENEQDGYVSDGEVKDAGSGDDEAKKVEPPKKKRVVNKRFVLNTERLKGPKGIHTIEKLYEGFKFQGKGHEKEDLDRVMKRLEYWGFRLYPKLDFDDFLDKCEQLGHKKDLQTYLKRYRMGMLSADDIIRPDFIEEEAADEAAEKQNDPEIQRTENQLRAQIDDEEFQRLFDEELEQRQAEQVAENI